MLAVRTLLPIYSSNHSISHICLSLCEAMAGRRMDVRVMAVASDPAARRPFTQDAVPRGLQRIAYRLGVPEAAMRGHLERRFVRNLRAGDIAYIWPGASLGVYEQARQIGCTVLAERINCHRQTAKAILDDAYARLGLAPAHDIFAADIQAEKKKLSLADLVFSPSPNVTRSLVDSGVAAEKILASSYGWDPDRFNGNTRALPPAEGVTFLFAGLICIRKGAHLLLRAWAEAAIGGRLVLMGKMTEEIRTCCASELNRSDVLHIEHTQDVAAVYRSADAFVFPSLEEGSPLVSYEAMACGLPVLASPMAAGEIVRHQREGLVIDAYEQEAWVTALRRLVGDDELRRTLSKSARLRAEEFTWARVGRQRADQLLARFDCPDPANGIARIVAG